VFGSLVERFATTLHADDFATACECLRRGATYGNGHSKIFSGRAEIQKLLRAGVFRVL
jgi:hypothetical protein